MPHRSTRGSSMSWSRPPGTTLSSTRTTGSKPTTVVSNTDYDPCRGYVPTAPQVIIAGLAFLQNIRRGHYELATETTRSLRVATAFAELAHAI